MTSVPNQTDSRRQEAVPEIWLLSDVKVLQSSTHRGAWWRYSDDEGKTKCRKNASSLFHVGGM